MTTRSKLVIGMLSFGCGLAFITWGGLHPEPGFQGLALSRWVARYYLANRGGSAQGPQGSNCVVAFKTMGEPVLEYLIALETSPEESPLRVHLRKQAEAEVCGGNIGLLKDRLTDFFSNVKPYQKADLGFWPPIAAAVETIDPKHERVMPYLAKAFTSANPEIRSKALFLVDDLWLTPSQRAAFASRALIDEDESVQMCAVHWIFDGRHGIDVRFISAAVVARLTNLLSTVSSTNRLSVAFTLAALGANAPSALPYLEPVLSSCTDQSKRCAIAAEICRIDPSHPVALPVIYDCLTNSNYYHGGIIKRIGSAPRPPLLPTNVIASLLRERRYVIEYSDESMALGVPRSDVIQLLNEELETGSVDVAAHLILLAPNHPKAISMLTRTARNLGDINYDPIRALGDAGSGASNAIPELMDMLKTARGEFRKELISAVAKIENASRTNSIGSASAPNE
jgi:hypothetical protein